MLCRRLESPLSLTTSDLLEVFEIRFTDLSRVGWGPRLRFKFKYFTPDEYYEAVVNKLVTPKCTWLDVGCGRNIFQGNNKLAHMLAARCGRLVGLDPDETIEENTAVHERIRDTLEDFQCESAFDLVTLRMVAEHITDPARAVKSLASLTKTGSKVVVYTVNRKSPISIISWLTPFWLHGPIKRFFWETDEKDTFPVWYRMNTREDLGTLFLNWGFKEIAFAYLDDCRTFSAFRAGFLWELYSWWVLKSVGLNYPENCLLGIYERV